MLCNAMIFHAHTLSVFFVNGAVDEVQHSLDQVVRLCFIQGKSPGPVATYVVAKRFLRGKPDSADVALLPAYADKVLYVDVAVFDVL